MATSPTYNYETELSDLDRRQKLMEAMSQGAAGPMQTFQSGGRTGKISPFQMLNQVFSQYLAGQGMNKVKQERSDLSQRYSDDLVSGMKQFQQTEAGGAPVDNFVMQPDASGTPQTVPAPPDRKKAIFDAMASNHPVLKEMAMKMMMEKPADDPTRISAKDGLSQFDPLSVAQNPGDPKQWKRRANIMNVEGALLNATPEGATQVGGVEYSDPLTFADGSRMQGNNMTGKLHMLNKAPGAVSTNINVSANPVIAGQKEGAKTYFEQAGKKVSALGDIATTAQNNLNSLAELKNLDAKGIYSNVTSGPATFLSNLAQAAGMEVDTSKLANTENYKAITTDLWQGLVAKYGGNRGVTKDEAVEIKNLLPLATNSPKARQQLFSILENVSHRQVAQYEQANEAFAEATFGEDPRIFSEKMKNIYAPSPAMTQPALSPPQAGGTPQRIKWDDLK